MVDNDVMDDQPHVVIIGGGFGGLHCGRGLRRAPVRVTIVDRRNHHLFQPLLYEVATAALSPADIASPIRRIFARQRNAEVLLGEAVDIDTARQRVILENGALRYDYLVVAAGADNSYFGHEHWQHEAPGLKSIEDALEIRRRFLIAFEEAEREGDEAARRAKLTFVVVGGGPTGVELAGTMSEIARRAIPRDFRAIDTTTARVVLIEAGDRVLASMPPSLSAKAKDHLESLGVELVLGQFATAVTERGVATSGGEHIDAENVFWAAGVKGASIGGCLGADASDGGRVAVRPNLSVHEHDNVFVIGDLATATDPRTGEAVPGVAPAAIQMGRYVAQVIRARATGRGEPPAFAYRDKGMLATIGRARAVGTVFGLRFSGFIAWVLWALVHIMSLVGYANRIVVLTRWAWAYLVFQRGARLITGNASVHLRQPTSMSAETTHDDVERTDLQQPASSAARPSRSSRS